LPTLKGKPVVLVISDISVLREGFLAAINDQTEIVLPGHDPFGGFLRARKIGGPDIIAIGCLGDNNQNNGYVWFLNMVRKSPPVGLEFTGPIIGLCEGCEQQLKDAGCDEVINSGLEAAQRILEIIDQDFAS